MGRICEPLVLATLLVSPVIGSFLGVVIERVPAGRPFLWGRSECDACRHPLGLPDLIPFASWIFSRGRCRHCGARLSVFYPLIEFAAVGVALWSATATSGWHLLASCIVGWGLLAFAVTEWRQCKRIYVPALALLVWLAWLYGIPAMD